MWNLRLGGALVPVGESEPLSLTVKSGSPPPDALLRWGLKLWRLTCEVSTIYSEIDLYYLTNRKQCTKTPEVRAWQQNHPRAMQVSCKDLVGAYMRVGPNAQYWPPKKRTHAFDGAQSSVSASFGAMLVRRDLIPADPPQLSRFHCCYC